MIAAVKWIQEANKYRAKEGESALQVSDTLMAIGMANTDYANENIGHPQQFKTAENLAWGYTDPFDAWYTQEKANYDAFQAGKVGDDGTGCPYPNNMNGKVYYQTGHYLNIIDDSWEITGFGVSQNGSSYGLTYGQEFLWNNGVVSSLLIGRVMSASDYLADLTAYKSSLENADQTYKDAQAAADAAAANVKTAESKLAADKTTAQQAADELAAAQQTAKEKAAAVDTAQKTYDDAMAAQGDKSEALKKATADQQAKDAAAAATQAEAQIAQTDTELAAAVKAEEEAR